MFKNKNMSEDGYLLWQYFLDWDDLVFEIHSHLNWISNVRIHTSEAFHMLGFECDSSKCYYFTQVWGESGDGHPDILKDRFRSGSDIQDIRDYIRNGLIEFSNVEAFIEYFDKPDPTDDEKDFAFEFYRRIGIRPFKQQILRSRHSHFLYL